MIEAGSVDLDRRGEGGDLRGTIADLPGDPRSGGRRDLDGITLDVPVVSAFYTTLYFLYGIALIGTYNVFRARFGAGTRTALYATGLLVAIHRGFGLGMVAMGTMPLGIYLAFSASMVAGSLLGGTIGLSWTVTDRRCTR